MSGVWRVTCGGKTAAEREAASRHSSPVTRYGFTLVEMLVVLSILGILAALTVPALKNLGKANNVASASRQLLDAVGHARQLAIANHTTVYMVFVPTNFWSLPPSGWWPRLTPDQQTAAINLCDKQLSGYAFVAYGAVGDQPGQHAWHYLEPWQALPENSFVAAWKFGARNATNPVVDQTQIPPATYLVRGFDTVQMPFPTEQPPAGLPLRSLPFLPCIAFDYQGRLTSGQNEYIPLARGSVLPARNANKAMQLSSPSVSETPPGNSFSMFNLVQIDSQTGRAVLLYQHVQ